MRQDGFNGKGKLPSGFGRGRAKIACFRWIVTGTAALQSLGGVRIQLHCTVSVQTNKTMLQVCFKHLAPRMLSSCLTSPVHASLPNPYCHLARAVYEPKQRFASKLAKRRTARVITTRNQRSSTEPRKPRQGVSEGLGAQINDLLQVEGLPPALRNIPRGHWGKSLMNVSTERTFASRRLWEDWAKPTEDYRNCRKTAGTRETYGKTTEILWEDYGKTMGKACNTPDCRSVSGKLCLPATGRLPEACGRLFGENCKISRPCFFGAQYCQGSHKSKKRCSQGCA